MPREDFEAARKARVLRPSALKKIAKMEMTDPKQIDIAMNIIADSVGDFLGYIAYTKATEILKSQWYGRLDPEYYNRTYDLLSALNVTKNSNGHYDVGIDARALRLTPKNEESEMGSSTLGQHVGFDGESVAAEIWTFINYGVNNTRFPQLSYEGIDIIGQVESYINSQATTIIRKFLTDNGIPVK